MSSIEKKKIKRSRLGCHRCKRLKVKCTEEKPACITCVKAGVKCDYSLKLTWGGRPYKNTERHQQINSFVAENAQVLADGSVSLGTPTPGGGTNSSRRNRSQTPTASTFLNVQQTYQNEPSVRTPKVPENGPDSMFHPQLIGHDSSLTSKSRSMSKSIPKSTSDSTSKAMSNSNSNSMSPSIPGSIEFVASEYSPHRPQNSMNISGNLGSAARSPRVTVNALLSHPGPVMQSSERYSAQPQSSPSMSMRSPFCPPQYSQGTPDPGNTSNVRGNHPHNVSYDSRHAHVKSEHGLPADGSDAKANNVPCASNFASSVERINPSDILLNSSGNSYSPGNTSHSYTAPDEVSVSSPTGYVPSVSLAFNGPQIQAPVPQISTPDFFGTTPYPTVVDTPQSEAPFEYMTMEESDSFSADLARIQRAFPTSPKSPFYDPLYGQTPPRKDLFDTEALEMDIAGALGQSQPNSGQMVRRQNELRQSALASHSIPPSIVPLPEILLKVPYYRQLLHFWVNVAADNLVPAPYLYKDNPFKKILPQMAMHYPSVLTTILAFAARARDDLEDSPGTHSKIIDQLLGRSCDELLKQLQDSSEQTSDGTFATSLLLSSFEVVHSNDFDKHRAHATGAAQIMVARTRKSMGDSPTTTADDVQSVSSKSSLTRRNESDIAFFLSRWFMYVDVIGALSSTRDRGKYLRTYRNPEEYTPVETIPHLETDDSVRDIDFLLGFDPKLLPHFVNISLLIDEVDKYMAKANIDTSCIPQFIVAAALELKDKFFKSYEAGETKRSLIFDAMIERNGKFEASRSKDLMTKDNILRSTNRLYYNTGLLNLYRRVLLLPRSSPLVQDLIAEMTEIFEFYIEPCSAAQVCTIFCLFCAGCDNLNESKREFYCQRFQGLAERHNMNAAKSLVIMSRCWQTGEDWITAANMLDIDLVLM